jgi:hypothetical protein
MSTGQVHYTNAAGHTVRALYTPGTAYWLPWQADSGTIANGFAESLDTGASVAVTESLYNAMAAAAGKLLVQDDPAPSSASEETAPKWAVFTGAGLLVLGVVLAILLAYAAPQATGGGSALDTMFKILFGGGAVLLGIGLGGSLRGPRFRTPKHAADPDAPEPVNYAPGHTSPPKNDD